ncbi:hypothetical protein C8Q74DRAFT_1369232 [Fomes fomentarius]|nr:hypothetical protein C8Q74DRAFT_1369232 [Fomes fomentarius]
MPQESYQRARARGHLTWRMFYFKTPLQELDFTRFRFYAARVRVLKTGVACEHLPLRTRRFFIHSQALRKLEAYFEAQGWRILPHLRQLEHFLAPTLAYPTLRSVPFLCNPGLRSFHVRTYMSPDDFASEYNGHPQPEEHQDFEEHVTFMLARLKALCPKLREFTLAVIPSSVPIVNATMDACLSFKHLTEFCCGETTLPITFKAFTHLALLPNLQVLRFASDRTYWTFDDFWLLDHKPKSKIFPALRDIGMIVLTIDLPLKILPYISSRQLKRIEVKVMRDVPRNQINPLFSTILALKGYTSIDHIHMMFDVVRSDGDKNLPPDPICEKTLLPLLALPQLSRLELDILCPWDIDDAFLVRMSLAWPELTVLELGIHRPWQPENLDDDTRPIPRVTFHGLIALSRVCPNLQTLGVEWAPDVRDTHRRNMGCTVPNVFTRLSALQQLRVGFSRIRAGEEMGVAGLLSNMFPQLREVESYWRTLYCIELDERETRIERGEEVAPDEGRLERWATYERKAEKWRTVEEMLPELVLIREQERAWNEEHGVYEKAADEIVRMLGKFVDGEGDGVRDLEGTVEHKLAVFTAMEGVSVLTNRPWV